MDISISDFFGSYPDIRDPDFNTLLSQKKEFSELAPKVFERPPKRGGRFSHQTFAIRFGTWYDRGAFFHDPGTGKSCIIAGLAELFKDNYRKTPDDPTRINHVIILVKGPALEENIRNEIVCKCTDRIYETEMVLRASNETAMKSAITKELGKWYTIQTYHDFAKEISEITRPEDLESKMSNVAIFVDEAHNIATVKDLQGIGEVEDDSDDDEPNAGVDNEPVGVDNTTYQWINRAFHKGKRNKIFLFTATPMINGPNEFPFLMNLILPSDFQMPFWTEEQFAALQFEQIEPYLRGRVSYIRALDTGARKVYPEGSFQPEGYQTRIYPCDMSDFQYSAYLQSKQSRTRSDRKQAFHGNERQVSNFVFPDGTWGISGWQKYVVYEDQKYKFRNDVNGQTLKASVANMETLTRLSSKYAQIVQICQDAYFDRTVQPEIRDYQGIIFVYFPVYVHGSGAIMGGLCLEEHGYEKYSESKTIFTGTNIRQFGPCGSYNSSVSGERTARIAPRRRYALLTNRTTRSQIFSMFDTLKSYENRYGEYIQVVIVSRIGQEGISIDHAIAEIMTSSSWNFARQFQAEDRIFRSTSHEVRLEDKRRRMIAAGQDPSTATIDVRIYNMASVYIGDPNSPYPQLRENDFNTIDAQMFLLSENKNRAIRRIIRFCKRASFDCYINYPRNVRPTDVNGSPSCDYTECAYTCAGIRQDILSKTDRTTKILYYSESEVASATQAIKNLYSRFSALKIDQIHRLIPEIDPIFIDMALEEMIRENTRITDRMGFFGYLRDAPGADGSIYLEKDPFLIAAVPENTAYSSSLIGTQDLRTNVFADYVANQESISQTPQLNELIRMGSEGEVNTPAFSQLLESLALSNKVVLLEYVLLQIQTTQQTNDFSNAIISAFNHSIFEIVEPVALLQQTAFALSNRGKGRGRKPNPDSKPKVKKINLTAAQLALPEYNPNGPAERVIVHTLLNQSFERTSYNAISKFFKAEGKLRIYKASEGSGWRDLNQYEQIVYNAKIQHQLQQVKAYFDQFPIYGIQLPPMNKLQIRDREFENANRTKDDARYFRNGKVCTTWNKPDLINLLYRLGIYINNQNPPGQTRYTIIAYLVAQGVTMNLAEFPDSKLVFFYYWYQSGSNKETICNIIQQFLERTGKIFNGKIPQALLSRPVPTGPDSGTIQIPNPAPETLEGVDINELGASFGNIDISDLGSSSYYDED